MVTASYLGTVTLGLLKSRLSSDKRVVLCEAPPNFPFHAENEKQKVKCPPIATPRRLPSRLSPPRLDHIPKRDEAHKVSAWTRATPRPSKWPFDCVLHQINSNSPVEDRGVITMLDINRGFSDEAPRTNQRWLMAAVIDGHSGWQTAEYLSRRLASRVQKAVNEHAKTLTAESLSKVFCDCFEKLDDEIKMRIEPAFNLGHSSVAKAGATTCATFVTPNKIVVANLGDSRAYLSRGGKMMALTNQHNAGDPAEAAKLRDAHPNEDDLIYVREPPKEEGNKNDTDSNKVVPHPRLDFFTQVRNMLWPYRPALNQRSYSYTKGRLQLTRAFGDFYLKDLKFAVDWDMGRLLVKAPHSFPYISKLPEVTVLSREPGRDEFLVVASDGVWDELTGDEVGALVRAELRKGKGMSEIAQKIHMEVMERAAKQAEITVQEMQELKPKQRRRHYDDMTIAIVNLKHEHS